MTKLLRKSCAENDVDDLIFTFINGGRRKKNDVY